jgi:hypothetical protein
LLTLCIHAATGTIAKIRDGCLSDSAFSGKAINRDIALRSGCQNNRYKILPKLKTRFNTERKTVMICEDDPDLLNLFGMAFRSKYNIMLVSSGKDCIEKFIEEKNRGNKIHLLLLDYRLRDIPGDSVVRKIKEYNELK